MLRTRIFVYLCIYIWAYPYEYIYIEFYLLGRLLSRHTTRNRGPCSRSRDTDRSKLDWRLTCDIREGISKFNNENGSSSMTFRLDIMGVEAFSNSTHLNMWIYRFTYIQSRFEGAIRPAALLLPISALSHWLLHCQIHTSLTLDRIRKWASRVCPPAYAIRMWILIYRRCAPCSCPRERTHTHSITRRLVISDCLGVIIAKFVETISTHICG